MPEKYHLLDLERTIGSRIATYWVQGKHGYTKNISEAGLFNKEEAEHIVDSDFDNNTVMISVKQVDKIFQ